jgi:hypothetical protein
MKCSEIVNYVMEQRALRQQEPTTVNAGGKAVPNLPLKGKKRKPYGGPVIALVELPRRQMLTDTEQVSKK